MCVWGGGGGGGVTKSVLCKHFQVEGVLGELGGEDWVNWCVSIF